ncbi:dihydrolipoyl dehydrogenase [Lipomyces doorenjongii]|uniref:dihydrolipoyl dehydrogenase n=1 Tax=Lipomyces doorenjongii TaxID=383834 RepID=UPI0034CF67D1
MCRPRSMFRRRSPTSRLAQSATKTCAVQSAFLVQFRRGLATAPEHDLVVIGAGPGGYVAAIKAAQFGLKTACIDKRGPPGGTCGNVECIASLLNNSHLYHRVPHDTKRRGINVGDVKLNIEQFLKAKDEAVSSMARGVELLLKQNKIDYFKGVGKILGADEIEVKGNPGEPDALLRVENIIIATGSEATSFPNLIVDEKMIVTSTGAIAVQKVPNKMVGIGGGIIGLELGSVWSRLGADVTIVEFQNAIGAGMDSEISKLTQRSLSKQGLKFKLSTKVLGAEIEGETVKVTVDSAKGGKVESLDADVGL